MDLTQPGSPTSNHKNKRQQMPIAYYNEHDPIAAQWIRNLITRGAIAPGDVDERSIEDVCPDDLWGYTQCHFFAGVAVWSYALRSAGVSDDTRIWTGSPPYQPFSTAGSGDGFADERHLWPALFHLIEQCRPIAILGEQVEAAIKHSWLDLIQTDLENIGYAFGATGLCAAGFGAPHIRQRLFFAGTRAVADSDFNGRIALPFAKLQADTQHDAESCGDSVGVADAECGAAERHGQPVGAAQGGAEGAGDQRQWVRPDTEHGGESGHVGNPECSGLEGHAGNVEHRDGPGRIESSADRPTPAPGCTNGHWADAEWLPFRDSKIRPVEPGTSPMVAGPASRVGAGGTVETENIAGKLKGYGNAIVAPVAMEFIIAFMGATA